MQLHVSPKTRVVNARQQIYQLKALRIVIIPTNPRIPDGGRVRQTHVGYHCRGFGPPTLKLQVLLDHAPIEAAKIVRKQFMISM